MSRERLIAPLPLIGVALLVASCVGESRNEDESTPDEGAAAVTEGPPPVSGDTITTASGLRYIIIAAAGGPSPTAGDVVSVHYTGWLTNGEKFDSSRDRGQPIEFPLGQGRVIRGWDEGIDSLSVGSRARLIIPPALGYGATPRGPIPANSTLIFDVELMGIRQ